MTRKQMQTRAALLRSELVRLSRDGWKHAKPCDYVPLETELKLLDRKLRGN